MGETHRKKLNEKLYRTNDFYEDDLKLTKIKRGDNMQRTISLLTIFIFLGFSVFLVSTYADKTETTKKKVTTSKKYQKKVKQKKAKSKKLTINGIVEKYNLVKKRKSRSKKVQKSK